MTIKIFLSPKVIIRIVLSSQQPKTWRTLFARKFQAI